MVIQRNWKTTSANSTENVQLTSSSEDSNSSWQTISNSTSSSHNKNANSSKTSISSPQMAESVLKALKQRYNGRSFLHQSNGDAAAQSLEIMRLNIQEAFDKEIDGIVRKYIDIYFRPALKNVKENLGETSVSGDSLQKIGLSLLENSKLQYMPRPTIVQRISQRIETDHQATTNIIKRKDPPEGTNIQEAVKRFQTNVQLRTVGRTKQIFWNVSNLNTETLFVLDFKANKIFGFVENGKERLASKHPELIRYLPDASDKDWLIQQKILPSAHRTNRILLLVHDEVCKIAQTDEYRNKLIKLNDLEGFKVPEFILQKMKTFFMELSVRSQSFLMNSQGITSSGLAQLENSSGTSSTLPSTSGSSTSTSIASDSIKTKSSLSSSHATLTALLSNPMETYQDTDGMDWIKKEAN